MLLWLLFCLADQRLILHSGGSLDCEHYERQDDTVLITRDGLLFSLDSALVDWERTDAEVVTPDLPGEPKQPPLVSSEGNPVSSDTTGLDLVIAKLDMRDASLIDVLRFMADMADVNLVIDASVPDTRGTWFFKDIQWVDAMAVILRHNSLDAVWWQNGVTVKGLIPY